MRPFAGIARWARRTSFAVASPTSSRASRGARGDGEPLRLAQHAQRVAAPDLLHVLARVTLGKQRGGDLRIIAGIFETRDAAAAIEVDADTDVLHARDLDGM